MNETNDRKLALITGASAGIGVELARLAAADGYDLVLVARGRDRLQALGDELTKLHGIRVHVEAADLMDPASPGRIFESVTEQGLTVDVLVNNAGFGSNGKFWELDGSREVGMVQVNVSAVVDLSHRFLPGMVERGNGRILNVASTAGFQPGPRMATYYASKAFVISFSEALSHELRGTGVTATALCPGATATEFADAANHSESLLFKLQVADARSVATDGWCAMQAGRVIKISGWLNWFSAFVVRFTPRVVVRTLAARLNTPT